MHPSFIYEIVFLLACLWAMHRWGHRFSQPGSLFVVFLTAYSLFRFFIEFTRGNTVNSWGLTGSQVFLLLVFPLMLWRLRTYLRAHRLGSVV